jgi:hypothetical protein
MYINIGTIARRVKSKNIGLNKADRYEIIRAALLKYKDLNDNMLVPAKFVVPVNDITWPEETWGMKLGQFVFNIRAGKCYANKREDLESIGFNFNSRQSCRYEAIRAALMKYKDLNDNMLVPTKFVVPVNDISWPEETWDIKLGQFVFNIRAGNSYADKREDLESIGFDFNPQRQSYKYEAIRVALMKYKDLKGNMLVPRRFLVPVNDISWPKETLGMNLGTIVMTIRAGSFANKREDLESIGFDFNPQRQSYEYEAIKVAFMKYKDLKGDMLVPQKFVVPVNDITWPKETWGIKLGTIVMAIRAGNSYVNKREDLESIGFDFNPQRQS